jgi:hypothetical protein
MPWRKGAKHEWSYTCYVGGERRTNERMNFRTRDRIARLSRRAYFQQLLTLLLSIEFGTAHAAKQDVFFFGWALIFIVCGGLWPMTTLVRLRSRCWSGWWVLPLGALWLLLIWVELSRWGWITFVVLLAILAAHLPLFLPLQSGTSSKQGSGTIPS